MLRHKLLGGKVQIYRRPNTTLWQCSASIDGRQYRASTKEDSLERAKEVAEDWYLGLRGKARAGILKTEKSFAEAAKQFLKEYGIITEGHRSPAGPRATRSASGSISIRSSEPSASPK